MTNRQPLEAASRPRWRAWAACAPLAAALLLVLVGARAAPAQQASPYASSAEASLLADEGDEFSAADLSATDATGVSASPFLTAGPDAWTSREGLASSLQIMLLLTVLSLAPAVLLMTTSFVRIIVVLGLLRQALGAQQLPPSQVITSLALFMTLLIMTPVWKQVYDDAIAPYSDPTQEITLDEAWQRGLQPIRQFMSRQIEVAGNSDDVWLFYQYLPEGTPEPETYDDVPIQVLAPAYILSELKVAFLIGFQVYLPFLILDIVVASVTISMGMMMLPPVMISLPFKLLLFVMVDGWRLVVGMLLESFAMGMG